MILKISKGNGKEWMYIDKVKNLQTKGKYKLNENWVPIKKSGKKVDIAELYVDIENYPENKKPDVKIIQYRREGNKVKVAYNGMAYLLNDDGNTIEKL